MEFAADKPAPIAAASGQPPGPSASAAKSLHLHREVFIMVLSLVVLGMMLFELLAKPSEQVVQLLRGLDNFFCFFFLADFAIRFYQAENKRKFFFGWGWVDLLSSIPFLDQLRWGRAARLVRIFRLLRAFRSMRWVIGSLFKDRSKGAVLSAGLITLLVMFGSSIAILSMEGDYPGGNIKTAGDALWWTMTTVTTVGYGDRYPVTMEGRLVGAFLMLTGISLMAVITGAIASAFTAAMSLSAAEVASGAGEVTEQGHSLEDVLAELRALRHEVVTLRAREPQTNVQPEEYHGNSNSTRPGNESQPESAGPTGS